MQSEKKLRELGKEAQTIWIADDHDPLEKFHTHYLKIMTNILECLTQQFHVLTDVVTTL